MCWGITARCRARSPRALNRASGVPSSVDMAVRRLELSREQLEERRLACAVRTDDGDELARPRRSQADVVDDPCRADRVRDAVRGERPGSSPASVRACASARSARGRRGRRSARSRRRAGARSGRRACGPRGRRAREAQLRQGSCAGISVVCDGPVASRMRCGTTRPTKATTPAAATEAPTASASATIRSSLRALRVDAEMTLASRSPSVEEVEVTRACQIATATPTTTNGRSSPTISGQVAPPRLPERPEDDVAYLLIVGAGDHEPDRGAVIAVTAIAGEDQRHRLGTALVARERVDDERRARRRMRMRRAGATRRTAPAIPSTIAATRADRGAACDPDHGRVGEGVAEDALEGRAGDCRAPPPTSAPRRTRGSRMTRGSRRPAGVPVPTSMPRWCSTIAIASTGAIRTAPTPIPSRSATAEQAGEAREGAAARP